MGTSNRGRIVASAATVLTLAVVGGTAVTSSPGAADGYGTTTSKYETTTTKPETTTSTSTTTTAPPPPPTFTTTTSTTTTSTTTTSTTTTTVAKPPSACTPGFWKNHVEEWIGFASDATVGSVFDIPAAYGDLGDATLLEALRAGGGSGLTGASNILLRAAVASLLNSAQADVSFPMTTDEIIAAVNAALASEDRAAILDLATELDDLNNTGDCIVG